MPGMSNRWRRKLKPWSRMSPWWKCPPLKAMALPPEPQRRAGASRLPWRWRLPTSLRRPKLRQKPRAPWRKGNLWRKLRCRRFWMSPPWRPKANRSPKRKNPRLLWWKMKFLRSWSPWRKRLPRLRRRKKLPVMPLQKRVLPNRMASVRKRLLRKLRLRKPKLSRCAKSRPALMRLPWMLWKNPLQKRKRPLPKRKLWLSRLRPLWRLPRKRKKNRCLRP